MRYLSFYSALAALLVATSIVSVESDASPFVIDLTRAVDPLTANGTVASVDDFAVTPGSSLTIDVAGSTTQPGGSGFLNGNSSGIGVITDGTNTGDLVIGVQDTITITFNFDGELLEFETINITPVTLTGSGGSIAFDDSIDGLTGTIPAISPFSFSAGDQIAFGVSGSISGLSSITVTPTPATASMLVLLTLASLRRTKRLS